MPGFKDIQNFLNYAHSNTSSRILLCGVLLFIIILLNPTLSYSRLAPLDPRDPYINRTIKLDVDFILDTNSYKYGNTERRRFWSFTQRYILRTSGNIIDPRFMVYDAYTHYAVTRRDNNMTTNSFGLGIRSTILRKFRFPITLHENRSYSSNSVTDNFGVRSLLKFKRLPTTTLTAGWIRSKNDATTSLNTTYGVEMSKRLGIFRNNLRYSYYNSSGGSSSSRLGITSLSKLSRVTKTSASLFLHSSTPNNATNKYEKGLGLTMSLTSRLSHELDQSHYYTFYSTETTLNNSISTINGQSYTGSWSFGLLKGVLTSGGLSYSENEIKSISDFSHFENTRANWSLDYIIARGLKIKANTIYVRNDSNVIAVTTNESQSEYFSTGITVNYTRSIRKVSFGTSYTFAYTEHLTLPNNGGGTGFNHTLSVTLGKGYHLHYKKVYFKTSLIVSRTDNLGGDYWGKTQTFILSADPRYWTKYGTMGAGFHHTAKSDWRELGADKTERLNFFVRSKTINKTQATATQVFTRTTVGSISSDPQKENTTTFNIRHKRIYRKGLFNISLGVFYKKYEFQTHLTRTTNSNLNATYRRSLLKRVNWQSTFNYFRIKDNEAGTIFNGLNFSNIFVFQMRRWSINLSHFLTHTKNPFSLPNIEERLMLSISRSFIRNL